MNIKELTYYIQSANINFLIGSGASRPYLATLCSIEKLLTRLNDDMHSHPEPKYKIAEASIYKAFYDSVIAPNRFFGDGSDYCETKSNYQNYLITWNNLLNKRHSRILNKQLNIFTTNIDLMIEDAASGLGVELNDGFRGSIDPIYDEANFMKSIMQTSIHFQHTSEVPVFNLLKIHGSINWSDRDNHIVHERFWYCYVDDEIKKLGDDKFVNLFIESEKRKTEKTYEQIIEDAEGLELSYDASEYDNFITAYKKFIIINPTKRKFAETVLDYHFYELMRLYSNALEKENSVLFVVGFSFADEHIATLTRRSAENNPTLKVIIFAYCDEEEKSLKKNIGIDSTCVNNNILIITPTKMRELNVDDDYNDIVCDIEHLDMNAINKIFEYINKTIHASYE